ncbi:hypothetical protein CsSME_00032647 [Camellia sinensis var. sinensis]
MRAVVARNLEGRQINLHPRTNLTEFYQDLANSEKALECLQRVLQIDGRFTKANYLLLHGMEEHSLAQLTLILKNAVGSHLYPQNPVLRLGSQLNFSVEVVAGMPSRIYPLG